MVNDTFYLLGDGTQALIFSYLGLTTFSYSGSQISYIFILLMVLAIMLARFITTFGMAGLEKLIKKQKYEFDARTLSVIWFGGIFRGTIAFALVISFDTRCVVSDTWNDSHTLYPLSKLFLHIFA